MADRTASWLISETKRLTGITDHALARKLAVDVEVVRRTESSETELPAAALSTLADFHDAAADAELVAPRVKAPEVAQGIWLGDSIELLDEIPDDSIDAIISDIPYGISLQDWDVLHDNMNSALLGTSEAQKEAGAIFEKRRKPINGWSAADREIPQQYYDWCCSWAPGWLRVLKPGGSAIVFAGRRMTPRCVQALENTGFNFRDMLAWLKPRAPLRAQRLSTVLQKRGELAEAERWDGWRVGNLAPRFEPIIWCFKPYDLTIVDNVLDHMVGALDAQTFKARTGSFDNVIEVGWADDEGGLHEAQKPVALMRTLIELCVPPNGIVLDPFAGSGSTGVAAAQSDRRYLLVERDGIHHKVATSRLGLPDQSSVGDKLPG